MYWDENSGIGCKGDDGMGGGCPSIASAGGTGTDPAEAFDINGGTGATPEPDCFMLLGSGLLGVAVMLRRRLLF